MNARALCVCLAIVAVVPTFQATAETKTSSSKTTTVGPKVKDFEASITVDGKTVIDTCRAAGASEARQIFVARWPKGRVGYVRQL
jgi:hypothetical protein